MDASSPSKTNTFYVTFYPDDFLEPDDDEDNFAVWDAWFTQIVDPLVAAGRLQWATITEMSKTFEAWEEAGQ